MMPDYDQPVDFEELAFVDADFAKVYRAAHGRIDFQDPESLQQLTKSLLKRDFGLTLELPDDRLCPPIPVRYRYVRWVQSLLDTTSHVSTDQYDPHRNVRGLDIGVGASCIYGLLATSRPNWTMYGTEIDNQNFKYAQQNVELNDLASRIIIHRSTPDGPLIPLETLRIEKLDFTMCNPPFYSSQEDLATSSESKYRKPSAICTGADVEMICPGGDLGFVLRMIEESRTLLTRVQWYTSMLGKLSSTYKVVDKLKEIGVTNWAITCLRAGNKTKRWAVAWSFADRRPRWDIACNGDLPTNLHPLPTAQTIYTSLKSSEEAADILNTTLSSLDIQWTWNTKTLGGYGTAESNVWSRSARRKRKRDADVHASADSGEKGESSEKVSKHGQGKEEIAALAPRRSDRRVEEEEGRITALAFEISVQGNEVGEEVVLDVRWLEGKDRGLFESFCGMLKRTIKMTGLQVVEG